MILLTMMPGFVIWGVGGPEEGKLVLSNGEYCWGAGGSAIPFPPMKCLVDPMKLKNFPVKLGEFLPVN